MARGGKARSASSRLNPAVVWLLSALAVAAAIALVFVRFGSGTDAEPSAGWVVAASAEEIKERSVLYVQEHELFVVTMASVPEGFIALSAWVPLEEGDGERRRMLFCTLSNLFENEHGELFDRAGHFLDRASPASMARIPLRVRNGMVEVAPSRATDNDLDRGTLSRGPPCGEWGPIEEGPPGYALASEAPAGTTQASLDPTRLKAGQRAELHFSPGRQISGLRWDLYQLEDDGLWRWRGLLVAGPGYKSYFDLAPLDPGGGIDDIGFGGSYSMKIKIPELAPGTYRLATYSLKRRGGSSLEREEWHYTDFEVTPN